MKSATLFVLPDGQVATLYTELIDLTALGSVCVQRLSRVEFHHETHDWAVIDTANTLLFRDPSRQKCLDWEQRFFTDREEKRHQ